MDDIDKINKDYVSTLGPTLAYLFLLALFGFVGNTVVFLVYYKRFKFSLSRTYILVLSVCDLLNNCVAIPVDILEIASHYIYSDDAGCRLFGAFTICVSLLESFILVAIALARERKICRQTAKPRTSRYVQVELICLGVFSLCMSIPFGVLKGLQTISIPNSTVNGTTCGIADIFVDSLFRDVFYNALNLMFVISVVIIIVCYCLIARHLYMHRTRLLLSAEKRQQASSGPKFEIIESKEVKEKDTLHHSRPEESTEFFNITCAEEEREASVGKLQMNTAKTSATVATTTEPCKTKEEKTAPEEVQVNIAEGAKYNPNISNVDESTGSLQSLINFVLGTEPSVHQSSGTEPSVHQSSGTEPSVQQSSGSQDNKMNPVIALNTNNSGIAHTKFLARLKATEEQADISSASDSSASSKGKPTAAKGKRSHMGVKKLPHRTTLTLFVLTVVFIVSYLPYLITAALVKKSELTASAVWVRNVYQIAHKSYFLNSAVNPLVYSFCSVQFRRECLMFLRRQ